MKMKITLQTQIENCGKMVPSWYSPAALLWLEIIWAERFGCPWEFSILLDGSIKMKPAGIDTCSSVVFRTNQSSFPIGVSNLPCGWWLPLDPWRCVVPGPLPTPGFVDTTKQIISSTDNGYCIEYDLLGLVYWVLTRSEEIGRTDLDQFKRFPASASHAMRHAYLARPIVDEWLCILRQVIDATWPDLVCIRHQTSIKVSHDVDQPGRYAFASWPSLLRRMGGDLLIRREPMNMLVAPFAKLGSRKSISNLDPCNRFDWIMDVSEMAGLQSAFYFICGRTNQKFDADYEIEHPSIRALMRRIHQRGHEIGLHPSFETFLNPVALAEEAIRLRGVCADEGITQSQWGGRMHYLRWSHPTTLRAWTDAGIHYDSTLGYADQPGFRCGTCFEFPAFDPIAREPLALRLRPLVAMESTIIEPTYLGLGTGERAAQLLQDLKQTCSVVGGTFTLLWHNSNLTRTDEQKLYQQVVMS